jgi:hypothetical protein
MDMIRSMLGYSNLPINLWIKTLKMTIHIVNRVPSKSVSKMSCELWTGRKPSLNYLCVWGFPGEGNMFNSNIGKLDSKIVSFHFIGYPYKSKVFCLYYFDRHTKFVEMRHVIFLEDTMMMGAWCFDRLALKRSRFMCPLLRFKSQFFRRLW